LSGKRIAAVAEEALRVLGRNRREPPTDDLNQRPAGAGLGLPQERLDPRKSLLDEREVRDFFERQPEPPEDVALRGGRDPRPFGLLEELEVL
jgi:hypothetical protein